jgi:predicted dehydrogenase/aryl-alcohol dehydrogenase-like predicted oxidoreductase
MAAARWGIIGPGAIAHNFADALAACRSGRLAAIAGRDEARRDAFADRYGIEARRRHATYEGIATDPLIDALYISTPHPWHAELAIMGLRAGKAVLVEKPAGMNAAEVTAVTEVARQEGRFFGEAFMYLCHPQITRMLAIIAAGEIGEVRHIRSYFGFSAGFNPASRLYDRALGGGGILDVGGYPVSFARLVAGASAGKRFDDPVTVRGTGILGQSGVDEVAYGLLSFASGITAEVACAVARTMENTCTVEGTLGRIELPNPWVPGRNAGPSDAVIRITVNGETREEQLRHPEQLFTFEAEAISRAILSGATEAPAPAMTPEGSIGNAEVLDRWRAELGYRTFAEDPATNRALPGVMPATLPRIPTVALPGVALPVSRLVMGCDNRNDVAAGAVVWDAFIEAGGTTFDTAFVYGGGLHETVLGQWIRARGLAGRINVIAKGAHSPYCLPDAIAPQLDLSLARLGIDFAPIYIMHRDNPEVPVGEFVEALNRLADAGRIGIFGGSNWTTERFDAANAYAARHGLRPMSVMNNNLSLATMERPVWPGCLSVNTPATLGWLRATGTIHLSWSSQARGYFLPEALRNRLPPDTAPETCFGSPQNAERRRRAETLAAKHGVSAHNIATAWVLAQSFPSLALIGPRSPGEIASTLPALGLTLTPAEVAWLNLEAETSA